MNWKWFILLIGIGIMLIVSMIIPNPVYTKIETKESCVAIDLNLDIAHKLAMVDKQNQLCTLKCEEFNLSYTNSSRCESDFLKKEGTLSCLCEE